MSELSVRGYRGDGHGAIRLTLPDGHEADLTLGEAGWLKAALDTAVIQAALAVGGGDPVLETVDPSWADDQRPEERIETCSLCMGR